MAVKIGHARSDENGKAYNGKAGDQTGREVMISNWYLHAKGWVVLRPKDAKIASLIADCMRAACANDKIGYDQYQRNTLYNIAKPLGFDPAKVIVACETDCSALVRVCCAYAGIMAGDFNTTSQAAVLMASGAFEKMTATKYTGSSDYLRVGDILVTKTKGHTAVVLTNGAKAGDSAPTVDKPNRPTIRKGSKGADVKTAQNLLIAKGHKLPKYGADGDFGGETDAAVRAYQRDKGLAVDGIIGAKTWAALLETKPATGAYVLVEGGNYYIRSAPVDGAALDTAYRGDRLKYLGITTVEGWYYVQRGTGKGYISGAGARLV